LVSKFQSTIKETVCELVVINNLGCASNAHMIRASSTLTLVLRLLNAQNSYTNNLSFYIS